VNAWQVVALATVQRGDGIAFGRLGLICRELWEYVATADEGWKVCCRVRWPGHKFVNLSELRGRFFLTQQKPFFGTGGLQKPCLWQKVFALWMEEEGGDERVLHLAKELKGITGKPSVPAVSELLSELLRLQFQGVSIIPAFTGIARFNRFDAATDRVILLILREMCWREAKNEIVYLLVKAALLAAQDTDSYMRVVGHRTMAALSARNSRMLEFHTMPLKNGLEHTNPAVRKASYHGLGLVLSCLDDQTMRSDLVEELGSMLVHAVHTEHNPDVMSSAFLAMLVGDTWAPLPTLLAWTHRVSEPAQCVFLCALERRLTLGTLEMSEQICQLAERALSNSKSAALWFEAARLALKCQLLADSEPPAMQFSEPGPTAQGLCCRVAARFSSLHDPWMNGQLATLALQRLQLVFAETQLNVVLSSPISPPPHPTSQTPHSPRPTSPRLSALVHDSLATSQTNLNPLTLQRFNVPLSTRLTTWQPLHRVLARCEDPTGSTAESLGYDTLE